MIENLECRRFRNRIDAFVDGELTPSEREEMRRHAETCPECGKLLSEYQNMLEMLSELDEGLEIPPEAAQAWRSGVRDECEQRRSRKGKGWIKAAASIAAALVVLLGVTSLYRNGLMPVSDAFRKGNESTGTGNALYQYEDGYQSEGTSAAGFNGVAAPMAAAPQTDADYASTAEKARGVRVESDGAADDAVSGATDTTQAARQPVILRSASRSLESTLFDADLESITTLTEESDGWFETRSVSGQTFSEGGTGRKATLTARVPTGQLDEYLDALKGIGSTVRYSDTAEDVSVQYYDSQTRLSALRAQYERLTELITDAADLSDLVALEDKLYEVQYEIDSLEGQLRDIESRAGYSSVTITLSEVREYTEPPIINPSMKERLANGFAQSLEWLKGFLQDMLVAVVAFSPALVVVIPAVIILWLIIRGVRRKRRRSM